MTQLLLRFPPSFSGTRLNRLAKVGFSAMEQIHPTTDAGDGTMMPCLDSILPLQSLKALIGLLAKNRWTS